MHSGERHLEITTLFFTLFIKCPFPSAAAGCPFADVRALKNLELKFRLAEKIAMHPQSVENLRKSHEACYRKRMRTIMPPRTGMDFFAARKMNRRLPLAATNRL